MAKHPELQLLIGGKWISRDGAPAEEPFLFTGRSL